MSARIGSLFTGYGGLDLAVEAVTGARTVWVSDNDKGAAKILAHRYPHIPNHGDITQIDWASVEPVDIITGGFPCQDVSHAGKRAGMHDHTRTGLWSYMRDAIDQLRPSLVVAENVRGLLSAEAASDLEPCPWCLGDTDDEPPLRALGAVLADLADIGYDAQWCGLRAASVGAPHGRFRVFVAAWPSALDAGHRPGSPEHWQQQDQRSGGAGQPGTLASQNTDRATGGQRRLAAPGQAGSWWALDQPAGRGRTHATADASGDGWDEGRTEPAGELGGPDAPLSGDAPAADADSSGIEALNRRPRAGDTGRREPLVSSATATPDTSGGGCDGWAQAPLGRPVGRAPAAGSGLDTAPDAGREHGRPRTSILGGAGQGGQAGELERSGAPDWGIYAPAIHRWEQVLGRPAPPPLRPDGKHGAHRLNPAAVEFLMGLPEGWVMDVPNLTRSEQLKAFGNGVVPQQAAAALTHLLSILERAA